jgi:hypothetical protein
MGNIIQNPMKKLKSDLITQPKMALETIKHPTSKSAHKGLFFEQLNNSSGLKTTIG